MVLCLSCLLQCFLLQPLLILKFHFCPTLAFPITQPYVQCLCTAGTHLRNSIVIYIPVVSSGPPRDITLMDTDPAMLSVSYRPPATLLRNGDVTGYVIRYTRVGSGVSQNITVSSSSISGLRTSVIPGLLAFTIYSVEVAAANVNGTGPFSDPVTGLSGQDSE